MKRCSVPGCKVEPTVGDHLVRVTGRMSFDPANPVRARVLLCVVHHEEFERLGWLETEEKE